MSFDESELPPGWYPIEPGQGRRYWTGQNWLSETEARLFVGEIPLSKSQFFKPVGKHPRWMQWTVAIGLLMAIGSFVNDDRHDDEAQDLVQSIPSNTPSISVETARAVLASANRDIESALAKERQAKIDAILAEGGTLPEPSRTPTSTVSDLVSVDYVIDGDTLVTTDGDTIRLIGIDTPEVGACGYDDATLALEAMVLDGTVELVNPASVDNEDKYNRLLRYVVSAYGDAGQILLEGGYAVARYDYLDGYDWHPRQDDYRAIDAATSHNCGDQAENPSTTIFPIVTPPPPTEPVGIIDVPDEQDPEPTLPDESSQPWNQPGPDLDCVDIGHRVIITGTDYHHLDGDGDGIGCESYG